MSEEQPPEGGGTSRAPGPQPRAVRTALASLPVSEASEEFWTGLEAELGDEPPLQIAPRPAIRPIDQPPPTAAGVQAPVSDVFDSSAPRRSVVGRRTGGATSAAGGGLGGGSSRVRLVVLAVIATIVALAALGGLIGGGDDSEQEGTVTADRDDAPGSEGEDEDEDGGDEEAEEGETTETTAAPTTTIPQPRGLEPDVPLHAGGAGLLETGGMRLRDVGAVTGVEPEINDNAFVASGGSCFDATVPGADDLTLWFRNDAPEGEGLEDPANAVLSALSISSGSERRTDVGIGIGTHELELYNQYDWLQQYDNPFHPQGLIYVASDEAGNAVGYVTGNEQILEIRVGHEPLVTLPNMCQL